MIVVLLRRLLFKFYHQIFKIKHFRLQIVKSHTAESILERTSVRRNIRLIERRKPGT
jgi:hypothetical protein